MLNKLIRGNDYRKSRLHDEKGNFVSWKNLIAHSLPAAATTGLRLAFGYRPQLPWISFAAIQHFSKFLTPESRVLEFGSGMSTLWFARRAGFVCSVEHDEEWYRRVRAKLAHQNLHNVRYEHVDSEDPRYCTFGSDDVEGFDLILVDGRHRSSCLESAVRSLRPGGILFLDNTDFDVSPKGGDMRRAETLAREFAASRCAQLTTFTDFAPTYFFVQESLMVTLPP